MFGQKTQTFSSSVTGNNKTKKPQFLESLAAIESHWKDLNAQHNRMKGQISFLEEMYNTYGSDHSFSLAAQNVQTQKQLISDQIMAMEQMVWDLRCQLFSPEVPKIGE